MAVSFYYAFIALAFFLLMFGCLMFAIKSRRENHPRRAIAALIVFLFLNIAMVAVVIRLMRDVGSL